MRIVTVVVCLAVAGCGMGSSPMPDALTVDLAQAPDLVCHDISEPPDASTTRDLSQEDMIRCGDSGSDTASDINNCGTCGNVCNVDAFDVPRSARPLCIDGVCYPCGYLDGACCPSGSACSDTSARCLNGFCK